MDLRHQSSGTCHHVGEGGEDTHPWSAKEELHNSTIPLATENNKLLIPANPGRPVEKRARAGHPFISAFRLSSSIIEAYFNHSYSVQLFTSSLHSLFSRTKVNITTKCRRS